MCKNSLFIPQSMKSKHSFLFYFKIAKELSEFRNYLIVSVYSSHVCRAGQNTVYPAFIIPLFSSAYNAFPSVGTA